MKKSKYTGETDTDLLSDELFMSIHKKVAPYTMTSIERQYALYKAAQYIVENNIEGDFVECGVWKGGSAMLIAYILNEYKIRNRKIYLYDTFAGMPEPTSEDIRYNNINTHVAWKMHQKGDVNEWCFASLEEVKWNLISTGYPRTSLIFIEGKVEETIPSTTPNSIALLRLDTDWYESTSHELKHLFPLLSKGGTIIIDDYGCWRGAQKAVDEYIRDNKLKLFLNRIDYTGRLGIKY